MQGIYYFETLSPIAKINIVRTILTLASINICPLFQMDYHNAFLPLEIFVISGRIFYFVNYENPCIVLRKLLYCRI